MTTVREMEISRRQRERWKRQEAEMASREARQKGAYIQWERIKKEYDEGARKGVVIIEIIFNDEIKKVVWHKSAYLRHVDKCIKRKRAIPKVLVEALTIEEANLKYMEL